MECDYVFACAIVRETHIVRKVYWPFKTNLFLNSQHKNCSSLPGTFWVRFCQDETKMNEKEYGFRIMYL